MPIFDTPDPIDVTVDIPSGDVRIVASDRTDTVVEVRPGDERDERDVQAAEQTRVEFQDGRLLIRTPKQLGLSNLRKARSVDVRIEVPTGSQVRGDTGMGDLRLTGRLGECRLKSGTGHIEVDRSGPLRLHTSTGNVSVDAVDGDADISTSSGTLRVGEVDGGAVVKNSNGATTIGRVAGDLRVRASNGDISVAHAAAGVDAKSANGSLRVGEVVSGSVVLKTSMGDIEVGIAGDTAAWLDVHTSAGRVRNSLDQTEARPERAKTVEVRAQTSFGDITVHRS
ncbi:DUF4097 family beta strand repeat-containing protein [Umezawaea sp. Da 62-37]|uniref:DUF4097 family beta strand repeat-containing protein n=1 Tax=Umezawaea sp. Da 62-37 TaxID=3075927 RepID=UPI0028F70E9F|nr:DUF4097 family beta strand repeat-containing protein [Umezawaea sp. Da 62-37]WNV88268.1 DUF4097 family beta strand repeat-containing protein [Umezawaea sp. Da 62-37]